MTTSAAIDLDEAAAVAIHEAAHAVAGRVQHLGVVRAMAVGDNPGVRTRWRRPATKAAALDAFEALSIVDLAGPAGEAHYAGNDAGREAAWIADEQNAANRVAAIVRLRHGGLAEDVEQLNAEQRLEVDALLSDLRDRAQVLVEKYGPAIKRVAVALTTGKPLDEAEVDAAMAGDGA
jgi:hypothetical protein